MTIPRIYTLSASVLTTTAVFTVYNYNQKQVAGIHQDTLSDEARERIQATYACLISSLSLAVAGAYTSHLTKFSFSILTSVVHLSIVGLITILALNFFLGIPHHQIMIKKLSWNFFSIATGYVFSPFCYLETKILLQASILLGATFGSISVLTAYNSNQTILQFRAFFLSSLLIVMCTKITVSCLPSYALIKIAHSTLIYGGIALSYGLISTSTFHMINRAQLNPIFNPLLHAAHIYLDLFILISQMI